MTFTIKRIVVFLFICISLLANSKAFSKQIAFDNEKYKKHLDEYKFPKEKEKTPTKQNNNISMPQGVFSQDIVSILFWTVIIALIVAALVYLIWLLSKSNSNYISQEESDNIINQIEENLIAANLDELINKAVQAGNWELAVKLNYFKVLKTLVVKELIKYRKDKSNKEYLYEIFDTPHFRELKNLNNAFDRLRFAKIAVTQTEYNSFSNECSTFIKHF